ncbi:MAG: sodium:alanine symporter family protein [Oscillospiraceae bacterium]|jgi:AGCS family alanine or glycine:cation symporter|nr:sodium:alanine symporter family protein [Oscillospiraceae bacterium]
MEKFIAPITDFLWGPPMLAVFLCTGLWFTLRTKGFQIRRFSFWNKETFGSLFAGKAAKAGEKSITQWQALTSALAACLGTGNIIGVATGILLGGPGAVFWMWVSALLGTMTCAAENILGTKFRWKTADGNWMGGPMAYLSKGLGSNLLACVYAVLLAVSAFGMGNMTQSNAIAEAARHSLRTSPFLSAAAVAVLVGMVIFGGVKRIGKVTEFLVPAMTGLFLLAGLWVIAAHWRAIPAVCGQILEGAFALKAPAGAMAAYTMKQAVRVGVSRGVFSNEAGLGSSAVVHAAAETDEPATQGLWGIAEVFLDTIVMCTVTAFVLLCSGVWTPGAALGGVDFVVQAFESSLGVWGGRLVSLSIALFAFATLTGWSFYGEQGVRFLFGEKGIKPYRVAYLLFAALGCLLKLEAVWSLADVCNALLAIPNLIGVLLLSGHAVRALSVYETATGAKKACSVGGFSPAPETRGKM